MAFIGVSPQSLEPGASFTITYRGGDRVRVKSPALASPTVIELGKLSGSFAYKPPGVGVYEFVLRKAGINVATAFATVATLPPDPVVRVEGQAAVFSDSRAGVGSEDQENPDVFLIRGANVTTGGTAQASANGMAARRFAALLQAGGSALASGTVLSPGVSGQAEVVAGASASSSPGLRIAATSATTTVAEAFATAGDQQVRVGFAAVAGTAGLTDEAAVVHRASAAPVGHATAVAESLAGTNANASATAEVDVVARGGLRASGLAATAATGSISANARRLSRGTATVAAVGSTGPSAGVRRAGAAAKTATGTMVGAGDVNIESAGATVTGRATPAATAHLRRSGAANLLGSISFLTATARVQKRAIVAVTGRSTITKAAGTIVGASQFGPGAAPSMAALLASLPGGNSWNYVTVGGKSTNGGVWNGWSSPPIDMNGGDWITPGSWKLVDGVTMTGGSTHAITIRNAYKVIIYFGFFDDIRTHVVDTGCHIINVSGIADEVYIIGNTFGSVSADQIQLGGGSTVQGTKKMHIKYNDMIGPGGPAGPNATNWGENALDIKGTEGPVDIEGNNIWGWRPCYDPNRGGTQDCSGSQGIGLTIHGGNPSGVSKNIHVRPNYFKDNKRLNTTGIGGGLMINTCNGVWVYAGSVFEDNVDNHVSVQPGDPDIGPTLNVHHSTQQTFIGQGAVNWGTSVNDL